MIIILPHSRRGSTQNSWLKSFHSFSFGTFQNPDQMGFGPLRVINEDRVEPEGGFGLHRHENMEILSYILSGTLAHKDSLGIGSTLTRGDIQRMTAGTGVQHSEFNPSLTEKVHFLQIWIFPKILDLPPSYEQKKIPFERFPNQLMMIASPDGRGNSVTIHQDMMIYACILEEGQTIILPTGRSDCWIQMVGGEISIKNGTHLKAGDGAAVQRHETLTVKAIEASEFLLFEFLQPL
jgi:redox-sensitive bicupin YhaK (pirin superfamily)